MTATVSHGADADRLDEIAGNLQQEAHRLTSAGEHGTGMLRTLEDAWQGADVEHFSAGWAASREQVERAAQQLQDAVAQLRREAQDQRVGSEGGGTPTDADGPVRPDNNDARDGLWNRLRRLFGDDPWTPREDPGADNVQLPKGADRDDPIVQEMLATPSGRAALDWMARNDIEIIHDPNQTGAVYDPGRNAMILGDGYVDSSTIIHESSHAQWDAEDRNVDVTETSREDYVANCLRDETEAVASEVHYAKEQREAGMDVRVSRAEKDYDAAYDAAIEGGSTPDEAARAGEDAIYELFTSGYYETSNTGDSYPDYYGSHWDSVN